MMEGFSPHKCEQGRRLPLNHGQTTHCFKPTEPLTPTLATQQASKQINYYVMKKAI